MKCYENGIALESLKFNRAIGLSQVNDGQLLELNQIVLVELICYSLTIGSI